MWSCDHISVFLVSWKIKVNLLFFFTRGNSAYVWILTSFIHNFIMFWINTTRNNYKETFIIWLPFKDCNLSCVIMFWGLAAVFQVWVMMTSYDRLLCCKPSWYNSSVYISVLNLQKGTSPPVRSTFGLSSV